MKNKRNRYINYNHSHNNNRRSYRNRRNRKAGFYAFIVLLIAIVLGLGAFYFTNERLKAQDKLKTQKDSEINIEATQDLVDGENSDNETATIEGKSTIDETATIEETTTVDETATIDETATTDGFEEDVATKETESEVTEALFIPEFIDTRTPVKVRGIYVTGPMAGSNNMQDLIELVDTTELNAMVIDIKNDRGEITYKMNLEAVQEMDADVNYISDMKQLIKDLKSKDIYLIARVVAFKDPILAEGKPELSLKNKDGTVFRDKDGLSWVNPYKREVWEYLVSVAKEAANLGFDEIQFDYIRFSTDSGMKKVDFGDEAQDKTKIEIITEFAKYVSEKLKPLGVYVSADVYGAIIGSKIDSNIVGQSYVEMSKYLDYICPMIYPSHYADGAYGIDHPDLEPYNLILEALNKSMSVLEVNDAKKNKAVVRSWLQDFTAVWLTNHKTYGPEEIRAQIQAVYDAGYEEWIFWNGSNNYTSEGLLKQ